MLHQFYLKKYFWLYATLFFSLFFFLLDEFFLYLLTFFAEENRLFIHRTALFVIVTGFITWSQYMLARISQMNASMVQTAKLATLGEMAAIMAHEISRPLSSIDLRAQLDLEDTEKGSEHQDFCQFVIRQSEKCQVFIKSLRTFGRSDSNTPKKFCNINDILQETLNLTKPYLSFVQIQKELQEDLPSVFCNSIQIEQVISNLLINAKDSLQSDNKGTITLRSNLKGQEIKIEVQDTGDGISKSQLDKIFDPFYTTKEEGKGTGLGLSISHRIIKEHHGQIQVSSEPGKTLFQVFLPISTN